MQCSQAPGSTGERTTNEKMTKCEEKLNPIWCFHCCSQERLLPLLLQTRGPKQVHTFLRVVVTYWLTHLLSVSTDLTDETRWVSWTWAFDMTKAIGRPSAVSQGGNCHTVSLDQDDVDADDLENNLNWHPAQLVARESQGSQLILGGDTCVTI